MPWWTKGGGVADIGVDILEAGEVEEKKKIKEVYNYSNLWGAYLLLLLRPCLTQTILPRRMHTWTRRGTPPLTP